MTNEELERKLQEAADQIQPRDFKEVWSGIGPQIKRKKKAERRRVLRRWIPAVTSAACVLVGCVFAMRAVYQNSLQVETPPEAPPASTVTDPPVSEPPMEEVYFADDLFFEGDLQDDEFDRIIEQTDMQLIVLTDYCITQANICKTENGIVKGGVLELLNSADNPTCVMRLKFYDADVEVSENEEIVYDQQYTTTSGAVVEYVVEDLGGARKYCVKTVYKDLQYFLEYTTVSDAGTQFFEELFD